MGVTRKWGCTYYAVKPLPQTQNKSPDSIDIAESKQAQFFGVTLILRWFHLTQIQSFLFQIQIKHPQSKIYSPALTDKKIVRNRFMDCFITLTPSNPGSGRGWFYYTVNEGVM